MNIDSINARNNVIPFSFEPDQYVSGNVVRKVISKNDSFAPDKPEKNQEDIIAQYVIEIRNIIQNDEFVDGSTSNSERYIHENCDNSTREYIKSALMNMYLNNLGNEKMLTGILLMISSIPYDMTLPEGPIMAMGLLQNKNYGVRDHAIQAFERWNSKKGIPVLKSLHCDRRWLQRYVEKVIAYLERDGID